MFDLHDIITRIDNIRAAALHQNQVSMKKELKDFDRKYKLKELPLPFLYERLFFGAGASASPTEKSNSLREIESVLNLFENILNKSSVYC
jgi:hypothetical protein